MSANASKLIYAANKDSGRWLELPTAMDAVSSPRSATLRQVVYSIFADDCVAYCRKNQIGAAWLMTCVLYLYDGEKHYKTIGIEGPARIIDSFHYELIKGLPEPAVCPIYLPPTGWVKAVKDSSKWVVWDANENFGFARETTQDRKEAEESFREAGLDAELVSKQYRNDRGCGIVPVLCASSIANGPLSIDAERNFGYFRFRDPAICRLMVEEITQ